LDRFINRRYRLKTPKLSGLVEFQIKSEAVDLDRIHFPPVRRNGREINNADQILCEYFRAYSLSARDIIKFLDALNLALNLTGKSALFGAYFVPVLVTFMRYGQRAMLEIPEALEDILNDPWPWHA
jgi:hypothetical protein